MSERLLGKRILLTGGVANIGLAILKAYVAEGATVAVVDRDVEKGEALNAEFPGAVRFFRADISLEEDIAAAVRAAADWMNGLDTLCLNAGLQLSGRIEDFSTANWDRTFAVNVRSGFLFVKEALPFLRVAGNSSVTFMASLAGKRGAPGLLAYSASKAATINMASGLAQELASDGVRVNAVCPGWIDTPFNQPIIDLMGGSVRQDEVVRANVPLGRQAMPEEVAPLFVYLASNEASYVTAQAINIDGGAYN